MLLFIDKVTTEIKSLALIIWNAGPVANVLSSGFSPATVAVLDFSYVI